MPWRPSIYMRRRMSRITLEVTDIRVERLQDITSQDAEAEGIRDEWPLVPKYAELWNQTNGPDSWDANPWVWVVGFKMLIPI